MILDRGICTVYRKKSTTRPGGKPTSELAVIHQSYYGELSFETAPARPTERREETRTDTRVRILQNRAIGNQDVCGLEPFDGAAGKTEMYLIRRAWHGVDEESGEAISDLTLEVDERLQAPESGQGTGDGNQEPGSGDQGTGDGSQAPTGGE